MAEDGKILKCRQWKDNNYFIIDETLMKLQMHYHTTVGYIQHKVQEIPFIGYIVPSYG